MAATHQAQDSADRVVSLQTEIVNEKNPSTSVNTKEQLISSKDDNIATSVARGASSVKSPKNAQGKAGSLGKGGEQQFVYQPPVYAPQPQTLFSGGFMNPSGQWEGYPHYVSVEGLDIASPGIYNENQSLMLSSGYANNPQMMYGSYSPVPTIGDGQPFFPMHYPFSNAYYQLPASPSMGYSNSATGMSQVDPMLQQEYFLPDGLLYSPTPGFHQQFGSFDGAPIQPSGAPGLFGQGSVPLTSGMHQGSIYGSGSYKARQQGGKFGGATPSWNATGRGFSTFDKGFKQEKGSISLDSQNLSLEFMNEQNRGPRATRPKKQDMENSLPEDKKETTISVIDSELYNRPDFVTEYKEARFFVIKSYTEDHVHKSIKYGVWASTASGNRKLNSAYCEVKEKQDHCPIFLFFSVNGSGQFCGVAEMIGPVDFDKSVDYWQQDKWSGQFPVKWHIVKDVPNSLLRHIVLENNDNKPVTNSRDTQEVKLEQGLQMLTIFKNHEAETTVLEDFDFYEQREKAMQENRKQQRAITEAPKPSTLEAKVPGDLMIHISDSFARVVQLEETKNNGKKLEAEDATTAADAAAATSTATVETEGVPSTKNPLEESS